MCIARAKIEYTGLITSNDTGCFDASDRYGKPDATSKVSTTGDWAGYRQPGYLVELVRRYDYDGTAAALFASFGRIK